MQDSLTELRVTWTTAGGMGGKPTYQPASHAVSSRFAETSQIKIEKKSGIWMGDHERSKSQTRYTNTNIVLQYMLLGSNAL